MAADPHVEEVLKFLAEEYLALADKADRLEKPKNDEEHQPLTLVRGCLLGKLEGQTILLLEDDHLTAMVLSQTVEDEGGTYVVSTTADAALDLIAQRYCSAAVLDNRVCRANPEVCETLDRLGIPYILQEDLAGAHCATGANAPTRADALVAKLAALLKRCH